MGMTRYVTAAMAVVVGLCFVAQAADVIEVKLQKPAGENQAVTGSMKVGGTEYTLNLFVNRRGNAAQPSAIHLTADPNEGYMDLQGFPQILGLGGKLYEVAYAGDEPKLTLTPFTGEVGPVGISLETERLSLVGEAGAKRVFLYRPGKEASVPVGVYRLDQYQLARKDDKGVPWYLCAMGTPESPVLTVAKGAKGALTIGEPYTARIVVPDESLKQFDRGAKEVALSLGLIGSWKENGAQLYPIGKGRPAAPKYVIKKADGKEAAKGQFAYG